MITYLRKIIVNIRINLLSLHYIYSVSINTGSKSINLLLISIDLRQYVYLLVVTISEIIIFYKND